MYNEFIQCIAEYVSEDLYAVVKIDDARPVKEIIKH